MATKYTIVRTYVSALRCSVLALALVTTAVSAAEIRVIAAAMMKPIFDVVVPPFERSSGHKLSIRYGTVGNVAQRVLAGEDADFVIASTLAMPKLIAAGRIEAASEVTLCKVGIGIVVPTGTALPRVASVDDFRQALLAAKTLVYANPAGGGAAGVHVARVIDEMGLSETLEPRTRYGAGGDVTEVTLAQGAGALGITQISEIVGKPGAQFVGPMPRELQNYTVCAAGIPPGARNREGVTLFIATLKKAPAQETIVAKGMEID